MKKPDPNAMASLIQNGISDAEVRIEDLRGDGECYAIHVISRLFSGMSLLDQHRAVYHALAEYWNDDVCGLHLTTSESWNYAPRN